MGQTDKKLSIIAGRRGRGASSRVARHRHLVSVQHSHYIYDSSLATWADTVIKYIAEMADDACAAKWRYERLVLSVCTCNSHSCQMLMWAVLMQIEEGWAEGRLCTGARGKINRRERYVTVTAIGLVAWKFNWADNNLNCHLWRKWLVVYPMRKLGCVPHAAL